MASAYQVRIAERDVLPALVAYLGDHVRDNGAGATPLFQPFPRGAKWEGAEKMELFARALEVGVGEPGWRRFWLAWDGQGSIVAHVDLRARVESHTSHRAALGMGVHRDYRRRGLGKLLIAVAVDWATAQSAIEWIDLEVLSTNGPAQALYRGAQFREIGRVRDMFHIDGEAVDCINMSRSLRACAAGHDPPSGVG